MRRLLTTELFAGLRLVPLSEIRGVRGRTLLYEVVNESPHQPWVTIADDRPGGTGELDKHGASVCQVLAIDAFIYRVMRRWIVSPRRRFSDRRARPQ